MKYQPKVTIVIPVYNGGNYLSQAIDSALNQTYPHVEIIVVNDGSNDDGESEKVALSYGERIRYYTKINGGVSSALNYALERMTGEWFSWLSHDDLYYPTKIEKQIEFINSILPNADLNKTVIHTATESIDKFGKVIKTPDYSDLCEKEEPLTTIIGNVYRYRLSGCSFLLPRACYFDVGGFREDIRTVSDVEYWYRLLFAGYQFYCMKNEILVRNRSHKIQVGKTKVSLFEKELNALHIDIADQLAKKEKYYSLQTMERYYLGLVKRELHEAAHYTKQTYINRLTNSASYKLKITLKACCYCIMGKARRFVRDIFRRIKVK